VQLTSRNSHFSWLFVLFIFASTAFLIFKPFISQINYVFAVEDGGSNDENTVLLIHSDTTEGSTDFTDDSDSAHDIIRYGDVDSPSHSTATSTFGATSMYFDGTGDYLKLDPSEDWDFGTGDFTIDFWAMRTADVSDVFGLISNFEYQNPVNNRAWTILINSSEKIVSYVSYDGTDPGSVNLVDPDPLSINTWHHIAFVYDSTNNKLLLFVNGMKKVETSYSQGVYDNTQGVVIGRMQPNSEGRYFQGYLDEIRISKGIARWTSDFTPPISEYLAPAPIATNIIATGTLKLGETLVGSYTYNNILSEATSIYQWYKGPEIGPFQPIDNASSTSLTLTNNEYQKYIYFEVTPVNAESTAGTATSSPVVGPVIGTAPVVGDSDTKLLIHSDTTEGSTYFIDSSASGYTVNSSGETYHESTGAKSGFGNTSIYFDGTVDYLSVADNDDWDIILDDFTIDFWIKTSATRGETVLARDAISPNITDGHWWLDLNHGSAGKINFHQYPDTVIGLYPALLSTTNVNDNIWHHVAVARNGTSIKLFIDGIEEASSTYTQDNTVLSTDLSIGRWDLLSNFTGYLDEIRISKGIARWTSDFSASLPSAPYPIPPSITGISQVGEIVTGAYTFSDPESDDQGASIMRWLRADTAEGVYTEIYSTDYLTEGANSDNYTTTLNDYEKFLKFEVTPIADFAPITGIAVFATTTQITGRAPTATNINITGEPRPNKVLTGSYTWSDPESSKGDTETGTAYQWYIATTSDGVYSPISGATNITYTIIQDDSNKFIKFQVIPGSSKNPQGVAATSTFAIGPIGDLAVLSDNSYISIANKTNFNIQCVGITDPDADTLTISYSFNNGTNWYQLGSTVQAPQTDYTHSANIDLETINPVGYASDGAKEIICKFNDGTSDSPNSSILTITKDTVIPTISDDYSYDDIWINSAQTITLSPSDELSGITTSKYCWGTSCDPLDGYTKLLIHSDTTNGSTVFEDSSWSGTSSPHTITRYGDGDSPIHSTATSTFGATSMYFDGDGDYLSIPDSEDWDLGTGDFTIDFWAKNNITTVSGGWHRKILSFGPDTATNVVITQISTGGDTGKIALVYDGALQFSSSLTINDDVWHHIALVREGDTVKWFIDGVLDATATGMATIDFVSTGLFVGVTSELGKAFYEGYIDELRVSKGIARWTSNFNNNLPTAPYLEVFSNNTINISTITQEILRYQEFDNAGNPSTIGEINVKVDLDIPANGSIDYIDGNSTSAYIDITVDRGTDALSGMSSTDSDYLLEYDSATLDGLCVSWTGSWADAGVSEVANATSYTFTASQNKCYKFRYTVADVAGNINIYATSSEVILGVPPTASNASITGTTTLGEILTGSYDWNDPKGGSDISTFQWYSKLGASPQQPIDGATSTTYQLTTTEVDKLIIFEVTPKSTLEPSEGVATSSAAVGPVNDPPTISLATSTQGYINNANKTAFNLECTGITDANSADTLTIEYSFNNGINWYALGSTTSPASNYIYNADIDLETVNPVGYATDEAKSIICKVDDGSPNIATSSALVITRDTMDPTISDNYALDGTWASSTQIITLAPLDTGGSGITTTKYCWTNGCDIAVGTASTTINISTSTNDTLFYKTWDNAGNSSATGTISVKIDLDNPTGSITYLDGYATTTAITIDVSSSDSDSGMSSDNNDYLLEYDSATLTADCGTFSGSWTDAGVVEIATSTSYSFDTTSGNCYIFRYRVKDVSGNVTTHASASITKTGNAPTITDIAISGEARVSEVLTGSYTYFDSENDPQGASNMRWLQAESQGGPYTQISNTTYAIQGQESFTYTVQELDINKYIKFEVTPVSQNMPTTGTATSTTVLITGTAPTATNISIAGTAIDGQTLTGSYTFVDSEGDIQGSTTFVWLLSETTDPNGAYSPISGETSNNYTIISTDANKYIKFQVNPVSTELPYAGDAVFSQHKGPVAAISQDGSADISSSEEEEITLSGTSTGSVSLFASTTSLTLDVDQKIEFEAALESLTPAQAAVEVISDGVTIHEAMNDILGVSTFSSGVEKVTFNSGVTGENVVIASTNNLSVEIPDATNIYADDSWDGTIAPPIISSTTVTIGGDPIEDVMFVGASGISLVFDKPAKVIIPSISGVPYYSVDGLNWAKIMNQCDNENGGGFSFPDECYIKSGSNTIIWTYHFTVFGMGAENIGLAVYTNNKPIYIGADNDAQAGANKSSLRIQKNGQTYYIPLVSVDSPYASNWRIYVRDPIEGLVTRALKVFGW